MQRLVVEILTSPNKLSLGDIFTFDFFQRNSAPNSFFAFVWDGRDGAGRLVPDGFYTLNLRVLKALGDAGNQAHYEEFTTPPIRVLTGP